MQADRLRKSGDERRLAIDRRLGSVGAMAIIIIFVLGVGNFALHRAVMESGHTMARQIRFFAGGNGRRVAMALEFAVLAAALLLAANGWTGVVVGYLIYTLLNGVSGWLILSGRV